MKLKFSKSFRVEKIDSDIIWDVRNSLSKINWWDSAEGLAKDYHWDFRFTCRYRRFDLYLRFRLLK